MTKDAQDLSEAIQALTQQLGSMDMFIARRFDEISMEINATSQQVDMAEEGIAQRFGEIGEALSAISFEGDGSTRANTGVELDAVIEITDRAANTIIDKAEKIGNYFHEDPDAWNYGNKRAVMIGEINMLLQEILMACSFQDLTGQRVRKTIESLKEVEGRIGETLQKFGVAQTRAPEKLEAVVDAQDANSQEDIDKLFS